MTTRILFVCLGNICRSPAAEGAVRALLPGAQTDSAGTSDWHVGEPPYGPMQHAAQARGLDISDLRARQFEAADSERFDLIVAMEDKNRRAIGKSETGFHVPEKPRHIPGKSLARHGAAPHSKRGRRPAPCR